MDGKLPKLEGVAYKILLFAAALPLSFYFSSQVLYANIGGRDMPPSANTAAPRLPESANDKDALKSTGLLAADQQTKNSAYDTGKALENALTAVSGNKKNYSESRRDENPEYRAMIEETLELTNHARTEKNLKPLKHSPRLREAASLKADDMAKFNYFSHRNPAGKTLPDWLSKIGYDYQKAGENLAVNFFNPEAAHKAWMDSPGHAENILNPDYEDIGIGVAEGEYEGSNTIFYAVMFGLPQQ